MAIIDHHSKPFDEGTLTKLELFEAYAQEWIPTFVMSKHSNIWIFAFFARPGYDLNGVPGSPIRLLHQINNQIGNIFQKNIKINVCFNEYDKQKYTLLQNACDTYVKTHKDLKRALENRLLRIELRNCDLANLFPKTIPIISKYPSLVYLDQNGIKFLADSYLLELEKSETTDFLYYVSSSYILRFGNTPEFQKILSIDIEKAKQFPYKYIHEELLKLLRTKLPVSTKLSLYPFTIKKKANVYGVIFGSSHPRGVEKFLRTAWEINNTNGSANFDIDNDVSKIQLDIFERKQLNKVERFKHLLREEILNKHITNNKEAFDFTLQQGHITPHATDAVRALKREKLISYDAKQPLISYEKTYGKNKQIITYRLLKKQ